MQSGIVEKWSTFLAYAFENTLFKVCIQHMHIFLLQWVLPFSSSPYLI